MDATCQGTVDDIDPEFLHDLRVAVRRTRSVLAQGKGVLPAVARRSYQEGFGCLGSVTGRPRDLDVYMIEWDGYVTPLGPEVSAALAPVHDHIARQREEAHATMAAALRSDRYWQLMSGWQAWLHGPVPDAGGPEAEAPVERMGIEKAPVATSAPRASAALAYRDLWAEIAGRLWPSR